MPKTNKTIKRRPDKKKRTMKYKKRQQEKRKKFPLKSPNQNYQKKTSFRREQLLREMFNMSMNSYNRESTPKSTPETPVTPNLLRLSQIGTPVNSYNRPVRQSRSPVNLSLNPEKVMSPNKMGNDLRKVRCSGRLTEEKCKEDKNCKWNSTEKKCRYKPLDVPNFRK